MNPRNDRTQLGRPPTAGQLAPRKRFRIQKLEERIAPHCRGRHRNYEECFTAWKCVQ